MKIAIVHDWLVSPGGAEYVLSALLELFPQADLFSLIDFFPASARQELLGGRTARVTPLQHIPGMRRFYPFYLSWMPYAVESIDLSEYDLIISSSHAVAKGVIVHPHQHHVCYCHTPMRYAWDRQFEYLTFLPPIPGIRQLAAWQLHHLRLWDQCTAAGVDKFIANSAFVARRIELAYRREAEVIYPPVDVDAWKPQSPEDIEKEGYYITSGRLVPYKHIHTIVEAFSRYLPEHKLVVVGAGPMARRIARMAGPNVKLKGYLSKQDLIKYVQKARAYVYAAVEDFGIAPVEALAAGTPVIAYNAGAMKEIIGGNPSLGLLYNHRSAAAVAEAVRSFEQQASYDTLQCSLHAENFSTELFKQRVYRLIEG